MSEWKEYTRSDDQIDDILESKNGFSYIRKSCDASTIDTYRFPLTRKHLIGLLEDCEKYLINDPHPYADLIKIWADTGCPVYARSINGIGSQKCHEYFPPFAHPDKFEYSLTPFDD